MEVFEQYYAVQFVYHLSLGLIENERSITGKACWKFQT